MPDSLHAILAEMRADAAVLRKHGGETAAATLDGFADRLAQSDELWLLGWMSEADASMASAHAARWFRDRFSGWEVEGLARRTPRGRQYRRCIVPGAWARQAAA